MYYPVNKFSHSIFTSLHFNAVTLTRLFPSKKYFHYNLGIAAAVSYKHIDLYRVRLGKIYKLSCNFLQKSSNLIESFNRSCGG